MGHQTWALVLVWTLVACGGPHAGAGDGTTPTSEDNAATETPPVNWLRGLSAGLVIRYEVRVGDATPVTVSLKVDEIIERGDAVAVKLVPQPPLPPGIDAAARWLVGDEVGLSQVSGADAHFVPVDDDGQLLAAARSMTTLVVPSSWGMPRRDEAHDDWAIDELELMIEGELRGDRCARYTREHEEGSRMVIICASVGIVEDVRSSLDGRPLESWKLLDDQRRGSFDE